MTCSPVWPSGKGPSAMPPKRKKWLITIALFAGLIALVAFFFLRSFPLAELADALKAVRPILLLPGFGLMFLFVLCEATASSRILAALGSPLPVRRCYTSSLLSFCCASITPSSSGGQPAQIYVMTHYGVPLSTASLTILVLSMSYQCSMLATGLASYALLGGGLSSGGVGLLLLFGAGINAALTVGMLCVIFLPKVARTVIFGCISLLCRLHILKDGGKSVKEKAEGGLQHYAEGAECIRRSPKLLLQVFCCTTMQCMCMMLVPAVVCLALGMPGQSLRAVGTQAVLTLSTAAFPLPGAVGAAEGGFLNLFAPIFGADMVAPALVLCRGINFYLFLPICAVCALLSLRAPVKQPA